jgi:hypothetical protein
MLDSPAAGSTPSHQAANASVACGQIAANDAIRSRIVWMTSDDHRAATT